MQEVLAVVGVLVVLGFIGWKVFKAKTKEPSQGIGGGGSKTNNTNTQQK